MTTEKSPRQSVDKPDKSEQSFAARKRELKKQQEEREAREPKPKPVPTGAAMPRT